MSDGGPFSGGWPSCGHGLTWAAILWAWPFVGSAILWVWSHVGGHLVGVAFYLGLPSCGRGHHVGGHLVGLVFYLGRPSCGRGLLVGAAILWAWPNLIPHPFLPPPPPAVRPPPGGHLASLLAEPGPQLRLGPAGPAGIRGRSPTRVPSGPIGTHWHGAGPAGPAGRGHESSAARSVARVMRC